MLLRISDNIILNVDNMVLTERHGPSVKITCTNTDVISVNCANEDEARMAMDRIMEQTAVDKLVSL